MSLELVKPKDPILRTELSRFNFGDPPANPIELYNELATKLIELNGLGLSANQVGWPHRFFVIRGAEIQPLFNPIIVDTSGKEIELEEGCLSLPGILLKITRPAMVKVRFANPKGEFKTVVFEGLTARIIQHEIDHLNGILFTMKVSKFELRTALERSKKKYVMGDVI